MKIDQSISNAINVQNVNPRVERAAQSKVAAEADLATRKIFNETDKKLQHEENLEDDVLDNAVEQANKTLRVHNKYIERSIHEKTHTIMYVLRDTETKEIIREFPPRKIQDMIAKMWELAGLLVDERR